MGEKRRSKHLKEEAQTATKKSKIESSDEKAPISQSLSHALYIYLKSVGLKKTAKSLAKEVAQDFKALEQKPDFALAPLFQRIDSELEKESQVKSDTSATALPSSDVPVEKISRKQKKEQQKELQTSSGPLARLNLEHWNQHATIDNSWQAKGGDQFAEKAAKELGRVRGKDFRTEKAKKKRATWNGQGSIDMRTNSVKYFDSD